jgi:hypothetical protein
MGGSLVSLGSEGLTTRPLAPRFLGRHAIPRRGPDPPRLDGFYFAARFYDGGGGGGAAVTRRRIDAPLPLRTILTGSSRFSLFLSARSFASMTYSQKVRTAANSRGPLVMASTTASGANLSLMVRHSTRRGSSHAGQNSNVCCAVSSSSSQ